MIRKILPHIVIVLAAMFITFWILDQLNPNMNFINNSISNALLLVFCITSFINAILSVVWYRKNKKCE
ncbi:hypothetical protein [Anaerosporobacter sp.]|uniref:hypothetical protein n=1 Tax=Anaerosporobacter sp. TaxID=1872529 RepID=UPI00286ED582|nr:hypothetical protein [Anaerosporobacter sp.]